VPVGLNDIENQHKLDHNSFFCDQTKSPWITEEGWFELLREYTVASSVPENTAPTWELLWLYVPDYSQQGKMGSIRNIP